LAHSVVYDFALCMLSDGRSAGMCAGGAMNSIGGGAVGGSNGCTATGGAVGGAEAMQQYGAGAGAGLSGLLNPGMLLLLFGLINGIFF